MRGVAAGDASSELWLGPETILRSVSFGGLIFSLVLIVHQRSFWLAILFAIALILTALIEFGGLAQSLLNIFFDSNTDWN